MKLTYVKDYVEKINEKFPELKSADIKRILNYCWKMIYLYNAQGNDILIKTPDIVFFTGEMTRNSLRNFFVYKNKLSRRIRFMFKRTNLPWDGYYYFALTKNLYLNYLKLSHKKYINFKNLVLYRLLDECKVKEYNNCYIFRLSGIDSNKFKKFYPSLRTKDAEFIIERDPLNMEDLMVSNNKYKYIK